LDMRAEWASKFPGGLPALPRPKSSAISAPDPLFRSNNSLATAALSP